MAEENNESNENQLKRPCDDDHPPAPPPTAPTRQTPPSTFDKAMPIDVLFDKMVRVVVGVEPNERIFEIHKGLIAFSSGYFNTALNGRYATEATPQTLTLKTEDPKLFELYQSWLYTRYFRAPAPGLKGPCVQVTFEELVRLWDFGQRYHIPLLQNYASDLIIQKVGIEWMGPGSSAVRYAYAVTPVDSKLRKLLIDLLGMTGGAVGTLTAADRTEQTSVYPREVLVDLLSVVWGPQARRLDQNGVILMDWCQYHVHEAGVRCNKAPMKASTKAPVKKEG
ncbi:hypothetical protein LTR17_004629 [Elasticomyces elasticus]|nr:hypothetical protein LTR17_004629 [Elasticomyces elasticus]